MSGYQVSPAKASSNASPVTSATSTSVVAAPAAGNHLRIHRLTASNSSATGCLVAWMDGSGGARRYHAYLPQGGVVSFRLDGKWDLTTATALYLYTSAIASVDWTVDYESTPD